MSCFSAATSYGPTISELRQVPVSSVLETTYFVVSLKNGAPPLKASLEATERYDNGVVYLHYRPEA